MLHSNDNPWEQDQVSLIIMIFYKCVVCVDLSLFNFILSYEIVLANHVCLDYIISAAKPCGSCCSLKSIIWCFVLLYIFICLKVECFCRYVITWLLIFFTYTSIVTCCVLLYCTQFYICWKVYLNMLCWISFL